MLKVSPETNISFSEEERETKKKQILNYIKQTLLSTTNTDDPDKLIRDLLQITSFDPNQNAGILASNNITSIPYSSNNDEFNMFYQTSPLGETDFSKKNRFLYELFYKEFGLLWDYSGKCYQYVDNNSADLKHILGPIVSKNEQLIKPMLFQNLVNTIQYSRNGPPIQWGNYSTLSILHCMKTVYQKISFTPILFVIGGPFIWTIVSLITFGLSFIIPTSTSIEVAYKSFFANNTRLAGFFICILGFIFTRNIRILLVGIITVSIIFI
jgi:hypothetical protein